MVLVNEKKNKVGKFLINPLFSSSFNEQKTVPTIVTSETTDRNYHRIPRFESMLSGWLVNYLNESLLLPMLLSALK